MWCSSALNRGKDNNFVFLFAVFLYSPQEEQPSVIPARISPRQHVCALVDGV